MLVLTCEPSPWSTAYEYLLVDKREAVVIMDLSKVVAGILQRELETLKHIFELPMLVV